MESCDNQSYRYKCICPSFTRGYDCQERFLPKTCKEQAAERRDSTTGIYSLVDGDGTSYQAFCDFGSERGFAWTLVHAFAFENNDLFKHKSFFDDDFPFHLGLPNWSAYRLSKSRMLWLRNHSKYWRVTCNFTSGVNYRDYLKTTFASFDIMSNSSYGGSCRKYDFIDIRGISCTNCTVWSYYEANFLPHVESYDSKTKHCQFDGSSKGGISGEVNFGYYGVYNTKFRCTSSPGATTEYWFGSF